MLDPDLVRCDLLKIKRKIYNSYPENSPERKAFLLANKMNEIHHLSKIVPPEMANFVFDEYKFQVKQEVIDIVVNLGMSISVGFLFLAFHQIFPKVAILNAWFVPSAAFILNAGRHAWHVIDSWRIMKGFKKEYGVIKDQIKKLSDDVKRIGDGK